MQHAIARLFSNTRAREGKFFPDAPPRAVQSSSIPHRRGNPFNEITEKQWFSQFFHPFQLSVARCLFAGRRDFSNDWKMFSSGWTIPPVFPTIGKILHHFSNDWKKCFQPLENFLRTRIGGVVSFAFAGRGMKASGGGGCGDGWRGRNNLWTPGCARWRISSPRSARG